MMVIVLDELNVVIVGVVPVSQTQVRNDLVRFRGRLFGFDESIT